MQNPQQVSTCIPFERFSRYLSVNQVRYLCALLLVAVVIAIYHPMLQHAFLLSWDDEWMVLNNYTFSWSWPNLWRILSEYYTGQYSPLNQIIYTLIYKLAGKDPLFFHAMSLSLHAINVLLVFRLTEGFITASLPGRPRPATLSLPRREGLVSDFSLPAAFITALLFAVHPLQVEAVAWISASKVLLYTSFYLAALGCYLLYLLREQSRYYYLALLAFVLSFGGKEQAVMLPFALLWADWLLHRNLKEAGLWFEKLPFMVIALVFCYVTIRSHASTDRGILSEEAVYPLFQRLALGSYALTEYLVKTLFPVHQLFFYPIPFRIGDPLPLRFYFYPILLIVMGLSLWPLLKKRGIWAGVAFFLLHIALVLHIVPMSRFTVVADRYLYLAGPGLFFLLALTLLHVVRRVRRPRWIWIPFLLYLISLGSASYYRVQVWKNDATLKKDITLLLEKRLEKEKSSPATPKPIHHE